MLKQEIDVTILKDIPLTIKTQPLKDFAAKTKNNIHIFDVPRGSINYMTFLAPSYFQELSEYHYIHSHVLELPNNHPHSKEVLLEIENIPVINYDRYRISIILDLIDEITVDYIIKNNKPEKPGYIIHPLTEEVIFDLNVQPIENYINRDFKNITTIKVPRKDIGVLGINQNKLKQDYILGLISETIYTNPNNNQDLYNNHIILSINDEPMKRKVESEIALELLEYDLAITDQIEGYLQLGED